jgi:hypothetical protein
MAKCHENRKKRIKRSKRSMKKSIEEKLKPLVAKANKVQPDDVRLGKIKQKLINGKRYIFSRSIKIRRRWSITNFVLTNTPITIPREHWRVLDTIIINEKLRSINKSLDDLMVTIEENTP